METPSLEALAESGRLTDLRLDRCKELCETYADRLVYFHGVEGDIPVGFDVSDSLLVTKYHLYPGDCVLGISAYTKRLETAEQFLDFILAED